MLDNEQLGGNGERKGGSPGRGARIGSFSNPVEGDIVSVLTVSSRASFRRPLRLL